MGPEEKARTHSKTPAIRTAGSQPEPPIDPRSYTRSYNFRLVDL